MKPFVSKRYIEGSIEWKNEKKEYEAKQHGLCVHCYGVGRIHAADSIIGDLNASKPCNYCRATGRNLDLEARSYEVHRERISKLSFSQCVREYVQLYKKEYAIDGFQPLTVDEQRWRSELVHRLKYDFRVGSCGNRVNNGISMYYQTFPLFDDVMFKWKIRLMRVDKKLFRYVWQKEEKENKQNTI